MHVIFDGMQNLLVVVLQFGLARNTAWIVATSSLIMFLPYIIEKERSDMERSQVGVFNNFSSREISADKFYIHLYIYFSVEFFISSFEENVFFHFKNS